MSAIRRNLLSLLATQLATWVMSLVVVVVVPRHLGEDSYGRIALATAYVAFFNVLGLLGTNQYLIRTIARDHGLVGPYVYNALVLKLGLAAVLTAVAIPLAMLLGYARSVVVLIAIGMIGVTLSMLNDSLVAGLAGMERMARPAAWQAAQVYASGILGVIVLYAHGSLPLYVFVTTCGTIIPLLANLRSLWPRIAGHRVRDPEIWRNIVRGGFPFFILAALILVYGTVDIPILGFLTDSTTVGRYGLAYQWVAIPVFIASVTVSAFLPSLSTLAHTSLDGFVARAGQAVRLVAVTSIPASVGITLIADDLLETLYQDRYAGAPTLMRILAAHIPIAGLDTVLATTLIASDRQGRFVAAAAASAIVTPLLNVPAIILTRRWWDDGGIGAAAVTVFIEVLMFVYLAVASQRGIIGRQTLGYIGRCIVASGLMGLALWPIWDVFFPVKIAIGAVVYVVASLALRTISRTEIRGFTDEFRRGRTGRAAPGLE